jgi:hypothetical protein
LLPEPQRDQVLHHLLAQVVVDPVELILAETNNMEEI